jgi:very-short-patch-repair endonuclease
VSQGESEVAEWLRSQGADVRTSVRDVIGPKELDIFLPEHNLAVEFNGLYFHSEIFKAKRYHDDKSMEAAAAGWRIIHVWEDEWRDKREIVQSMIKHRCGLNDTLVCARKCRVVPLQVPERRQFFEANHIDGDVRASHTWGLIDPARNKVVAAISTRKPMHKKWNGCLEIARFSTAVNEAVPGALGKLMKAVLQKAREQGNRSIVTYADSRFGSTAGAGYEAVGFELRRHTPPRFWWTDGSNRIDRFKIRADKENGLSEKEVADSHGVVKVWGCRNLFYELGVEVL